MTPLRIGSHYLLHEQIGQGGMGAVWRAEDTGAGVWRAVKVLRPEYAREIRLFDERWLETLAGPIEDRQAIMKGFAVPLKDATALARGTAPYNQASAKADSLQESGQCRNSKYPSRQLPC